MMKPLEVAPLVHFLIRDNKPQKKNAIKNVGLVHVIQDECEVALYRGCYFFFFTMLAMSVHAPGTNKQTDVAEDLKHVTVRVLVVERRPSGLGLAYFFF